MIRTPSIVATVALAVLAGAGACDAPNPAFQGVPSGKLARPTHDEPGVDARVSSPATPDAAVTPDASVMPDAPLPPDAPSQPDAPPPVDMRAPPPDAAASIDMNTPAPDVAASPLARGLVGYWKFDDGAGAMALDSSGLGHHGALKNVAVATAWVPGRVGGAVALDGGGWIQVERSARIDGLSAISIGAWVWRSRNEPKWSEIISRQDGTTDAEHFELSFYADTATFYVGTRAQGMGIASPRTTPAMKWVHLCATFDGRTLRLYEEGVEVASKALAAQLRADTTPILIGANANGTAHTAQYPFAGRLDDVALYDRALEPAEVASLARGQSPRP